MQNNKQELAGVIPLRNVRKSMLEEEYLSGLVIALDLMEEKVPSITRDDNLDDVMRLFSKYELAELPVIESRENKKITGIIRHLHNLHRHSAVEADCEFC